MYFLVGSRWVHKTQKDFRVGVLGLGVGGIIHFSWFDDSMVGSIQSTEFINIFELEKL